MEILVLVLIAVGVTVISYLDTFKRLVTDLSDGVFYPKQLLIIAGLSVYAFVMFVLLFCAIASAMYVSAT